jgi:hypothetical protein
MKTANSIVMYACFSLEGSSALLDLVAAVA